jgi:hypothetical protein
MSRILPAFCLMILSSIVLVAPAAAVTLLDDHFDDGALGTNSTGVGSGFTATVIAGGSLSEAGSKAAFNLGPGSLHSLYSNDNLNLFTPGGTTTAFHVSGGSTTGNVPFDFELGGDNGRIWLGLVTDSTNTGSFALPIDNTPGRHGLWVSLYDTNDAPPFLQATLGAGTNPNNYNGQLGWADASGNRTILAQFTYNTYQMQDPAHNAIDVLMTVTDTSYAISFAGPDGGVTLQNGAFSGNLPSAASGNFKTAATIQSGGGAATVGWEIDRITVNTVPEPSALLLVLVGLGGVALRKRCLGFRRGSAELMNQ